MLINLYGIFCLTTAIVFTFNIYPDILKHLQDNNELVSSKGLSYGVMFITSLIAAPALFLVCIIPSIRNRFTKGFVEGVDKD